jgi:hypothetical protein
MQESPRLIGSSVYHFSAFNFSAIVFRPSVFVCCVTLVVTRPSVTFSVPSFSVSRRTLGFGDSTLSGDSALDTASD